uniref:Alpha-tocopherol transfer protein-like n=1 Tax=Diabrotica virgifera virgifera TaxID=50390 RepID=A0A6P7GG41_DIAVI
MIPDYFNDLTEQVEIGVWNVFGTTPSEIKKNIEAIKEWLPTQPHLPGKLTDKQIRAFLMMGRGSVENAKPKIDMYFTMRSLFPDIFDDSHPFSKRILNVNDYIYLIPLPKLLPDYSRVVIMKLKETEKDPYALDPGAAFCQLINMVDVRFFEDLCARHIIIADLKHCQVAHCTKLSPSLIRRCYTVCQKAYTTSSSGIHIINAPRFFDQVIIMIKSILSPKLAKKIHLHKDYESVLDSIDKNILPIEYGGTEKSLDELEGRF